MALVGVFGAPAGRRERTLFSLAVPAGAPVSTQKRLKLTHLLMFNLTQENCSGRQSHTGNRNLQGARQAEPMCVSAKMSQS